MGPHIFSTLPGPAGTDTEEDRRQEAGGKQLLATPDPSNRTATTTEDEESGSALVGFVSEMSQADDGGGDWLPFALLAYERQTTVTILRSPQEVLGKQPRPGEPKLGPFLAMVREVTSARHERLRRLRDVLERGDEKEAIHLARQLVGLAG